MWFSFTPSPDLEAASFRPLNGPPNEIRMRTLRRYDAAFLFPSPGQSGSLPIFLKVGGIHFCLWFGVFSPFLISFPRPGPQEVFSSFSKVNGVVVTCLLLRESQTTEHHGIFFYTEVSGRWVFLFQARTRLFPCFSPLKNSLFSELLPRHAETPSSFFR